MGLISLLIFGLAFWGSHKICNACIKRGGSKRLIGILVSLIFGGFCIGFGYYLAYVGRIEQKGTEFYQVTYPVAGWCWNGHGWNQ